MIMGRSSKKIKSDRINALRKQYDGFLEDDKKRKERNEYILGRLDKMRFSNALLPLRCNKIEINPDRNAAHYRSARQQVIPLVREYQLSCTNPIQTIVEGPMTNVESVPETLLLQEISKKYILIPKLRSTFTNSIIEDAKPALNIGPAVDTKVKNEVKVSDTDNVDWKSKYEILNILKKEEKAEAPVELNKAASLNKLDKELLNNNNVKIIGSAVTVNKDYNEGQKYLEEIPEKDVTGQLDDQITTAAGQYSPTPRYDDLYSEDANHRIDETTENQHMTVVQNDPIADINFKLQNTNLEYNNEEQPNQLAEFTQIDQNVGMQPAYDISSPIDYSKQQSVEILHEYDVNTAFDNLEQQEEQTVHAIENVANTYNAEAKSFKHEEHDPKEHLKNITGSENKILDTSHRQAITSNEYAEEDNKAPPLTEPEVYADDVEYPVDVINVQEFTPNEDMQLKEGFNINPEGNVMQQGNIEPPNQQDMPQLAVDTEYPQKPVDTTGIEEFEAEQQGMFYSEQMGENSAYQGSADDVYNPEYLQNEAYQQNEYGYYEGTEPEVYQPVELNEHEETTQQYDQNYEQQYVGTYDQAYEQQSQEQHEQQYQETEGYPGQSEVEQLHNEQQNEETVEHVQQVLDNEQEFDDIQNVVQANEKENPPIVKANEAENTALPEMQRAEALEAS